MTPGYHGQVNSDTLAPGKEHALLPSHCGYNASDLGANTLGACLDRTASLRCPYTNGHFPSVQITLRQPFL